jgi:predicted transposase YdaD
MLTDVQDKQWAIERVAMLNDFLQESPLYQHILQQGVMQGEVRGIERGMVKGAEKERKQRAISLRQKILEMVQRRFPQQKTQASTLISIIENPEKLEEILLQLAFLQSAEEMHACLLEAIRQDE